VSSLPNAIRPYILGVVTLAACLACEGRAPLPEPDPLTQTGSATGEGSTSTTVQQELQARWNAVADIAVSSFDFHWYELDQFPHPTFKGGSPEAYQAFAAVLLLFLQHDDDFDFLARNHLFTTPLIYAFPSGQSAAWTFQDLVKDFSSNPFPAYGDISPDTRQALKDFLDRMSFGIQ
jgi:hypothetical protein